MTNQQPLKQEIDWEEKWQQGDTQWDHGEPSPALTALFENSETKKLIPEKGLGLVPGCGSGYDVVFLATKDRHVTGLDFSQTCVKKLHEEHPDAAEKNYDFKCADFYNFDIPADKYNLAYDYTFLCAMEPYMRPAWAKRYSEIIAQGGVLITLMFPIDGHEGGPPFAVDEQLYRDLLSDKFDLLYIKDAVGHSTRLGREKIAIFSKIFIKLTFMNVIVSIISLLDVSTGNGRLFYLLLLFIIETRNFTLVIFCARFCLSG